MKAIATIALLALGGCCYRQTCAPSCPPVARAPLPPAPQPVAVEPGQILLEATFFRVSPGPSEAALGAAGTGPGARTLTAAQADALTTGWRPADFLHAPSVVTLDGQEATIVVAETDTASPPAPDGHDPLSVPSWSGLSFWTRPQAVGSSLDLDVRGAWRTAPGEPAGRVAARRQVAPGDALLLWSERIPEGAGTSRVAVLVRPTRIPKTPS